MTTDATTVAGSPAMAPGSGGGARGRAAASPTTAAARPARVGAAPRRPVHLAVMAGAAAGLYAVSLAGVTALQAASNEALAAERDPIAAAIAEQRARHDDLEATMDAAAVGYAEAAAAYEGVLATLEGHEADLTALAKTVKKAEGSASNLTIPTRAALPRVSTTVVTRQVARPATNATTGASGGG